MECNTLKNNSHGKIFKTLAILFLLVEIGIIAVTLLIVAGKKKTGDSGLEDEAAKVQVKILVLKPQNVPDILEVPGCVESWNSVQIAAEVEGNIVFIGAEKGDFVKKDQALLKIDDRIYSAKFKMFQAELSNAGLHLARIAKLRESLSVSEKDYEDAQNKKTCAEAECAIAKTNLEKCEIRSPINGFLDERPVDIGEYVQQGKNVATIEEVDRVKIVFGVPEKDIMTVRNGETIGFTLDCCPGKNYSGKIIFIAIAADSESLSYRVEMGVSNPGLVFRPGMITRVKIVRRIIENAISIPLNSIMPRYGGHYVFVRDSENRAVLREVEIALISGENAIVSAGVKDGDGLVVEGQNFLKGNEPLIISDDQGK